MASGHRALISRTAFSLKHHKMIYSNFHNKKSLETFDEDREVDENNGIG